MKQFLLFLFISVSAVTVAQKKQPLKLRNALIIGHMNSQQDRFTTEVLISETFSAYKIKNAVSLNMVREGGDPQTLIGDSIGQILAAKGINTLLLVSVRGYDRKFQPSTQRLPLAEDLATENLFSIYKDDISSVTLEFHFYRDGQLVRSELMKISGVSSRESMVKKFRKELRKRLRKNWI